MTTTSQTIRIDKQGGIEEMRLVDIAVGAPGPGEIRIRHHASGLNYIDVYQRSGVYVLPVPLTLGMEGAYKAMRTGVVDEAWAREHHEYWYEDLKAGRIPSDRASPRPSDRPGGQQHA